MKTILKKIIMPLLAVILAIGFSFVSHAQEEKIPQLNVPGYYNTNPSIPYPCNIVIICSTTVGPVCIVIISGQAYQAFGKISPTDADCVIILFRLQ